jgi:GNAT superfamily N-acetyltransferase
MGAMSESVIIRPLRTDDYPTLIDLVRRVWYADFDERCGLLAAQADWENCLARTTTAFAAELDGKPVALILGRVDALDHRGALNTHKLNSLSLMLRTLFTHGGPRAIGEILGVLAIDASLRKQAKQAGHDWPAEVVLFVLDPEARGHGLGRRMFDSLLGAFRRSGVTDYFLFTDTTCDIGFYAHRGLSRVCAHDLNVPTHGGSHASFYLYEGKVPEEKVTKENSQKEKSRKTMTETYADPKRW